MILVYIHAENNLSKASKEAVTYAKKLGDTVTVVTNGKVGNDTLSQIGEYGASSVLVDRSVSSDDLQQLVDLIAAATEKNWCKHSNFLTRFNCEGCCSKIICSFKSRFGFWSHRCSKF